MIWFQNRFIESFASLHVILMLIMTSYQNHEQMYCGTHNLNPRGRHWTCVWTPWPIRTLEFGVKFC